MANANPSVPGLVRERLARAAGNRLPWVEVMRLALYEPGCGYYRRGVRHIGRQGDFYTSVSVGSLYGALLARFCAGIWERLGKPPQFTLAEQGAHDGTLAGDVMTALKSSHPDVFQAVQLLLVEPDPELQAAQSARLAPLFPGKVTHVTSWADAPPCAGVLLCNELLDAFPVHRVGFTGTAGDCPWEEWHVEEAPDGRLRFVLAPLSTGLLRQEVKRLGTAFPPGYSTEINLEMLHWIGEIHRAGFRGAVCIADYGHASREFHAPERHEGTLRRYHHHQTDPHVLEDLGDADLTAHVDFTRLAEAGEDLGFQVAEFIEQGRFLTRLTAEFMQEPGFKPSPAWMRQFQSLTHPGHLGHSFQILTLERDLPPPSPAALSPRPAALRRLGLESLPA